MTFDSKRKGNSEEFIFSKNSFAARVAVVQCHPELFSGVGREDEEVFAPGTKIRKPPFRIPLIYSKIKDHTN